MKGRINPDKCDHCGLTATREGHDGGIGTLEGVMNACCGHGDQNAAYVQFNHPQYNEDPNKYRITGICAINYMKSKQNQ